MTYIDGHFGDVNPGKVETALEIKMKKPRNIKMIRQDFVRRCTSQLVCPSGIRWISRAQPRGEEMIAKCQIRSYIVGSDI